MSKKNNTIAEQALSEMEEIKSSLKEGSKNIISSLMGEAVKDCIRESINEDDEDDDKDYEVLDAEQDAENDDDIEDNDADSKEEDAEESEPEEVPADDEKSDEEEDGDEWSEFEDYKVGDNEYDLTGVKDDETVVKVYKLLKDTDNVVVKKEGDKVQMQDKETGAEYLIDLGDDEEPESEEAPEAEGEMEEGCIKEDSFTKKPNEEEGEDGLTDAEREEAEREDPLKSDHMRFLTGESKKSKKTMKESKEVLFEVDLGYTDDYQDKDAIQGLNNAEPSKSGETLDAGVPKDAKKNFAGDAESKGEPFEEKVTEEVEDVDEEPINEEEIDETNISTSKNAVVKKIQHMAGPKQRNQSANGETGKTSTSPTMESYERKMKKALKENKSLKEAIVKIKGALQEAFVVNVNLGQFVKLVTENTTTQEEKVDILNRLNEAKTIEQSKALYESIKHDLNKSVSGTASINEGAIKLTESKGEEKEIYKSKELMDMIDLNRRMNLY